MSKLNRRNFIRSTLLGTAGTTIAARNTYAGNAYPPNDKPVIKRILGKTGIELPVISMGVMNSDNPNLVKAALKSGIVHFDTAHFYMQGNNEKMLGKVFSEVERDSIVVATKVIPADLDWHSGTLGPGSTKEKFLSDAEESLQRLQMDRVDILYHHMPSTRQAALYEPILEGLAEAKEKGITRFIGFSTHRNEVEVIEAAIESGMIDVILTAINFRQEHYPQLKETIAKATAAGIGIIGMKSLAGGYIDQEKQKPVNAKAALKWVLQDPNVTTLIPGFTTFDQLETDLEVMTDITLTDDEAKSLELTGNEIGFYCQGCQICACSCPKNLPVPDLMRAYMYAYGYRNLEKARSLLSDHGIKNDPCSDCKTCTVRCAKNFPVAEKIKMVSRLSDVPRDLLA
jgi:predicted aldo/keto reductase-like oxidoreductase